MKLVVDSEAVFVSLPLILNVQKTRGVRLATRANAFFSSRKNWSSPASFSKSVPKTSFYISKHSEYSERPKTMKKN